MSIQPGILGSVPAGTVLLSHTFGTINLNLAASATVGLRCDTVNRGGANWKQDAVVDTPTQVTQKTDAAIPGVVYGYFQTPVTGTSAQHSYNIGYNGDRDIEFEAAWKVVNTRLEILRGNGLDITDNANSGLTAPRAFGWRLEARASNIIRTRFRAWSISGLGMENRTLDSGGVSLDTTIAASVLTGLEFTIVDTSTKSEVFVDQSGTLTPIGSYTYTDEDREEMKGCQEVKITAVSLTSVDEIGIRNLVVTAT